MTDDPKDAFDLMRPREFAIAVASANRIMMEFLVKAGVDREELESSFRAKAGELIDRRYEDNAANLLRMMAGVVQPKRGA